eukprot:356555-Hanusia_phi.AAC.1
MHPEAPVKPQEAPYHQSPSPLFKSFQALARGLPHVPLETSHPTLPIINTTPTPRALVLNIARKGTQKHLEQPLPPPSTTPPTNCHFKLLLSD